MRTIMNVEMELDRSNDATMDGRLRETLEWLMGEIKPESSYFYAHHGTRTSQFVFDMNDSMRIPQH